MRRKAVILLGIALIGLSTTLSVSAATEIPENIVVSDTQDVTMGTEKAVTEELEDEAFENEEPENEEAKNKNQEAKPSVTEEIVAEQTPLQEKEALPEDAESVENTETIPQDAVAIDGAEEPTEMNPYVRASTIPGRWIQSGSRWWYRHNDGGYTKNGWEYINGKWYYFDGEGWMKTGWISSGGKWYYCETSGAMLTGWISVGGKWYYMNSSGAMQTGWVSVGGKWYYMNSSGAMQIGWISVGGKWYYCNSSGAMLTGWISVGGKWYYCNSAGVMQTGWIQLSGKWYYLNNSGEMLSNTSQSINGKEYSFTSDGSWIGTRLYVTRRKQQSDYWCWVAGAEMVGKYKNPNSTKSQRSVVMELFQPGPGVIIENCTGTFDTIQSAIVKFCNKSTRHTFSYAYSQIKTQIDNDNPLVVDWQWGWSFMDTHTTVVSGYNNNRIYVIDPWKDNASMYVNYTSALNGANMGFGKASIIDYIVF